MAMLRFSLCMFAIFLASLAAGCREKLPVAPAAKAVVIGVNDGFCRQTHSLCVGEDRLREYAGLAKVLSEKTGRRIELKYLNTEAQLIDAYKAGGLDGVICKTWAALRAGGAGGRELHRLADLSMPGGPNLLEGIFFVRADSPIKTMADLAGRTLGMGGPDAYEKSLAVTARLKQAGVAPAAVKVIPTCVATGRYRRPISRRPVKSPGPRAFRL
jgi:ABC-type phosphate/phosphonate transport system substrate-binding protein